MQSDTNSQKVSQTYTKTMIGHSLFFGISFWQRLSRTRLFRKFHHEASREAIPWEKRLGKEAEKFHNISQGHVWNYMVFHITIYGLWRINCTDTLFKHISRIFHTYSENSQNQSASVTSFLKEVLFHKKNDVSWWSSGIHPTQVDHHSAMHQPSTQATVSSSGKFIAELSHGIENTSVASPHTSLRELGRICAEPNRKRKTRLNHP